MNGYCARRVEDAWRNYFASSSLTASILTANIIRGSDFVDEKNEDQLANVPALIVTCTNLDEIMYGTGVYRTQANIQFCFPYSGSATTEARNTMLTTLNQVMLENDNITNDLTGSTDRLHVYDATFGGQVDTYVQDTLINSTLIDMVVKQKSA